MARSSCKTCKYRQNRGDYNLCARDHVALGILIHLPDDLDNHYCDDYMPSELTIPHVKLCPCCDLIPVLIRDRNGRMRIECPGCHDGADHFAYSLDAALDDWNDGITAEYVAEQAQEIRSAPGAIR